MSIRDVRDALIDARSAFAFTGAGISVASGIPDFRSRGGIWERFPVEEYGTIDAFREDPRRAWQFFFELSRVCGGARPNTAHRALARLEALGRLQHVVTQNVDGLHQEAGNTSVVELHGGRDVLRCLACGASRRQPIRELREPPVCAACGAIMKPDAVLFGEELPAGAMARALDLARSADVCLIVGTSGVVYPAAEVPEVAFASGATLCQFDLGSTGLTHTGRVHHFVEGPASETLPRLVALVEEGLGSQR